MADKKITELDQLLARTYSSIIPIVGNPAAPVTKYITLQDLFKNIPCFTVGQTGHVADYICDGAADDVQIQAAIDAAEAVGYGRILIYEGTYDITSPLIIAASKYVEIFGMGIQKTKLVLHDGVVGGAAPAGSVISTLPECQFVRFEDFSIDGNKANQTDAGVDGGQCGIYTASGNNLIMKNLWIQNVIREGIYPHEYSSYIENVYITNCDRAGFAIDGNRYTTLMNCYAYYNGTEDYAASGFYIVGGGSPNDDSHSAITNCHTYQNFGSGINITNCKNFSAIGNILLEDGTNAGAEFATQRSSLAVVTSKFIVLMGNHCKYSTWNGIHFDTSDNCVIQGNICIGNGGNAHTGVDSSGISITGGGHTISGNQCTDDQVAKQQTYGISLNGASVINCSVIGNYAKGNTADSVLQNGIGAGNDINHNIT